VDGVSALIGDLPDVRLPDEARDFVALFDDGSRFVKPFKFKLVLEQAYHGKKKR